MARLPRAVAKSGHIVAQYIRQSLSRGRNCKLSSASVEALGVIPGHWVVWWCDFFAVRHLPCESWAPSNDAMAMACLATETDNPPVTRRLNTRVRLQPAERLVVLDR